MNGRFLSASAGMPPALVYRAATGCVESVAAPAPPLGVAVGAPYGAEEHALAPGDVVLLMSDGLPERFNGAQEMFGYERVPDLLLEAANDHAPAAAIVRRLVEASDVWAAGHTQDDDVTLVAIRARHGVGQAA